MKLTILRKSTILMALVTLEMSCDEVQFRRQSCPEKDREVIHFILLSQWTLSSKTYFINFTDNSEKSLVLIPHSKQNKIGNFIYYS